MWIPLAVVLKPIFNSNQSTHPQNIFTAIKIEAIEMSLVWIPDSGPVFQDHFDVASPYFQFQCHRNVEKQWWTTIQSTIKLSNGFVTTTRQQRASLSNPLNCWHISILEILENRSRTFHKLDACSKIQWIKTANIYEDISRELRVRIQQLIDTG